MKAEMIDRLRPLALPGVIALASLVLGVVVSQAAGQSSEQAARIALAEARVDQLEQRIATLRGRPGSSAIVCTHQPVTAQTALEGRLGEAATRAGLTLSDTRFEVEGDDQLAVVGFSTTGEGGYAAAVAFLDRLAGSGPTLFVEELRVSATRLGVRLDLRGSVLCSTAGA